MLNGDTCRSCPRNSSLVYSGRTASADTKDSGGGANAQCLPTNPEYLTTINGTQSTSSSITGAEYEANSIIINFNYFQCLNSNSNCV